MSGIGGKKTNTLKNTLKNSSTNTPQTSQTQRITRGKKGNDINVDINSSTTATVSTIPSTNSNSVVSIATVSTVTATTTTTTTTMSITNVISSASITPMRTCFANHNLSALSDSLVGSEIVNRTSISHLSDKIDRMVIEFRKQIADINSNVAELVRSYGNSHVTQCSSAYIEQLANRIDSLERKLISDEIVIDGVPVINSDNLISVTNHISSLIEFDNPHIQSTFRLKSKSSNKFGSIIVKFNTVNDKNNFLRAVRKKIRSLKRPLQLNEIGFSSNNRFHIHERLTGNNYKIFRRALKLKAENLISKVSTTNGIVQINFTPDDIPRKIFSLSDLATIEDNNDQNVG